MHNGALLLPNAQRNVCANAVANRLHTMMIVHVGVILGHVALERASVD
jgi:hypothetical protein